MLAALWRGHAQHVGWLLASAPAGGRRTACLAAQQQHVKHHRRFSTRAVRTSTCLLPSGFVQAQGGSMHTVVARGIGDWSDWAHPVWHSGCPTRRMHLGTDSGSLPPWDTSLRAVKNPENHAEVGQYLEKRRASAALHIGCKCMSSSPTCRRPSQLLGPDWVASAMAGKVAGS
eukprot:362519-Chlamydomonas_euryale.AAC.8